MREWRSVEDAPEDEERDYLEHEDDQSRRERRGDVRHRRQRGRAQPLQDPELAPPDELDREARERGVRAAVAEQARQQCLRRGDAVDLPAVDGTEQHEEEQREEKDEERRFLAAPEDELLISELVEEDSHAGSSS